MGSLFFFFVCGFQLFFFCSCLPRFVFQVNEVLCKAETLFSVPSFFFCLSEKKKKGVHCFFCISLGNENALKSFTENNLWLFFLFTFAWYAKKKAEVDFAKTTF